MVTRQRRRYRKGGKETITADNVQLQQMSQVSEEVHAIRTHDRKCSNCGTNHKPRQCPAYRDACNACGVIGHWEKCCRENLQQGKQTRKPSDSGPRRRSNIFQKYKHGKHTQGIRKNKDVHSLETGYETDGESYQQEFFAVNLSPTYLDIIHQDTNSRDEAYTTLKIRPPWIRTKNCTLSLRETPYL